MFLDEIPKLERQLRPVFDAMTWAEEEIEAAQQRHGAALADRIWKSFLLLRPTIDGLYREMLYRAHCRELLDRVAAGQDTRPGTATECCVAMSEVSQRTPLTTSGFGLYARMRRLARLPKAGLIANSAHYEAIASAQIDELEGELRAKLRQDWRLGAAPR